MSYKGSPQQRAIAASEMAAWLAFATELEAPPDEIELLEAFEVDSPEGPGDLFAFRFRTHPPHWAADKDWMVGVAGPYPRSRQPTNQGFGYTFSKLEREDSMTLEQHLADLVGAVATFAASHRRPVE